MASHRKKESEGIALLSIYGDEDDDMEEQIPEEDSPTRSPEQQPNFGNGVVIERSTTTTTTTTLVLEEVSTIMSSGSTPDDRAAALIERPLEQILNDNFTSTRVLNLRGSITPRDSLASPMQEQQRQHTMLGIVDYGHDEVAMSPEPEDGEIRANDEVMYRGEESTTDSGDVQDGIHVLTPSNQATPGQLSEHNHQLGDDLMIGTENESKPADPEEVNMVPTEEGEDMDPLAKFLTPPPKAKCSEKLQEKIAKFLHLRKTTGRSYNSEVRNRKEYRNPDFLLHAVTYQDIDQIGSCFSKDVFDPHGYDKSDFYDEIEADMRREMERKDQERKKGQKMDFISGGTQPGINVPTPKISIPIPGLLTADGGGLNSVPGTVDLVARDGRHNKKSKWDKNPPASGTESVSAAALLSAANAGAGYSAFAQQRRREAEDHRRSSEKRLDKRS